jgi:hypothetical protein
MTADGTLALFCHTVEVLHQSRAELAALAVHLVNEHPAEVGSQVLDLVEMLHPKDCAVGALQGVSSYIWISCAAPGEALDLGIHRDLHQLLTGSCQPVCGKSAEHLMTPFEARDATVVQRQCQSSPTRYLTEL